MKRADIIEGSEYRAKVKWRDGIHVRVREVGVTREPGYRRGVRADGVIVELLQEVAAFGPPLPVGDTAIVSTRDIERPWTEADDERIAAEASRIAREAAVADGFSRLGFGVARDTRTETDVRVGGGRASLSLATAERILARLEASA